MVICLANHGDACCVCASIDAGLSTEMVEIGGTNVSGRVTGHIIHLIVYHRIIYALIRVITHHLYVRPCSVLSFRVACPVRSCQSNQSNQYNQYNQYNQIVLIL